jgi:peptidoglycan hydrolase-like amidase
MDKMADKADDLGEKYTSISKVHTPSFSNSGRTAEICFDTNRGKKCLSGEEFKTVFNLRAPAYVAIRSRLFDIEMDD